VGAGETYGSNKKAQLNGCSENNSRQVTWDRWAAN